MLIKVRIKADRVVTHFVYIKQFIIILSYSQI